MITEAFSEPVKYVNGAWKKFYLTCLAGFLKMLLWYCYISCRNVLKFNIDKYFILYVYLRCIKYTRIRIFSAWCFSVEGQKPEKTRILAYFMQLLLHSPNHQMILHEMIYRNWFYLQNTNVLRKILPQYMH